MHNKRSIATPTAARRQPFPAQLCRVMLVVIISLQVMAVTQAQEAIESAQRINSANELLRRGDVDEALEAYQHIASGTVKHDELVYNLGVAYYRKGDIEAAAEQFSESAASNDARIASLSHFNLGNCHYAQALQSSKHDTQTAKAKLGQAIADYRSALRGNPANSNARANIELANALLQAIEEKQQNQENEGQAGQQDKPQNEQNKSPQSQEQQPTEPKDQDDASDAPDQSKNAEQPKDQENQSSENEGSTSPDQTQPQSESSNSPSENNSPGSETEKQEREQPLPNSGDEKTDEPQGQDQQPGEQEKDSAKEAEENNSAQAQSAPTGNLSAANKPEKPVHGDQVPKEGELPKNTLMTREEAMKMLQAVRDRDMLRRLLHERQQRSQRVPVDKDW